MGAEPSFGLPREWVKWVKWAKQDDCWKCYKYKYKDSRIKYPETRNHNYIRIKDAQEHWDEIRPPLGPLGPLCPWGPDSLTLISPRPMGTGQR